MIGQVGIVLSRDPPFRVAQNGLPEWNLTYLQEG
jgi:hypothetical protein